ncbi:MAG: peptidyl-alpha-hydroxyglycine alpha-amidating lyase family protein [Anaerolineae bacterium]|nr:peptidyl-alpha-hydroxyglycine alpha-amidating lyase family protein [Anaerolineae bacterium]
MDQNPSRSKLLDTRAWEIDQSPIDLGYHEVKNWLNLPFGWELGPVAGVDVDTNNNIYIFHRGDKAPPLLCFDMKGTYMFSWDHISFGRPHMVLCDNNDNIWLIDDGGHIIYQLSPHGEVLFTLGVKDSPGEDTLRFNQPTDLAIGLNGELFISDGYGNKRIVKCTADGRFVKQWGRKGQAPGRFALPHAITSDMRGRIYVADRENWRVQIFDANGVFLDQWTHIGRPSDLKYVETEDCFYICDAPNHRVTKVTATGDIIGFIREPGDGIHVISVAPQGDIFVALMSGTVSRYAR